MDLKKKLFSHESPQLADTKWGVFWNFLSTFKMVVSRDLLRFFIVPITNIKMNKLVQSLLLPLTYLTLSVFPSRRRTLVRIYSNQFKNGFNIIILYLLIKLWKKNGTSGFLSSKASKKNENSKYVKMSLTGLKQQRKGLLLCCLNLKE